jgi:SAM-dependent methyltransferase
LSTLRLGNPGQFAAVRDCLAEAGYTEQAVCRKLGVEDLHEYCGDLQGCNARLQSAGSGRLKTLIQILLAGKSVRRAEIVRAIPQPVLQAMQSLGILCPDPERARHMISPVVLYPRRGLYFASDRWNTIDGTSMARDHVFSAINPHTHEFLNLLPDDPCDKFLDLCCGTGVAGLLAAKGYARSAWAVDITPRAVRFGEFNRRLNAIENLKVMQGNLYGPVKGMKFDRIALHPPYALSLKRRPIYADGGRDGEDITRAAIQAMPRYLAPGGRFYCVATGVEREGEPFEQRVRKWLGPRNSDFDIVYIEGEIKGPRQFAYLNTRATKGTWEEMDAWVAHLERLKVINLVHGLLIIQSRTGERTCFTVRRKKADEGGIAEAEWLRAWESAWAHSPQHEQVMGTRPLASPGVELHIVRRRENGSLAPYKFTLKSEYPFAVEYECPAWVAGIFERCDGTASALDLFEAGKRDNWIPAGLSALEFAETFAGLISRGILEIAGFEICQQDTTGR